MSNSVAFCLGPRKDLWLVSITPHTDKNTWKDKLDSPPRALLVWMTQWNLFSNYINLYAHISTYIHTHNIRTYSTCRQTHYWQKVVIWKSKREKTGRDEGGIIIKHLKHLAGIFMTWKLLARALSLPKDLRKNGMGSHHASLCPFLSVLSPHQQQSTFTLKYEGDVEW